MIKPEVPEARETADLLNELILKSQEILKDHPVNLKRMAAGKDPANSICLGLRATVRPCERCGRCTASGKAP